MNESAEPTWKQLHGIGTCDRHGKRLYTSRRAARRSIPKHLGVTPYPCDHIHGMWHVGHLPTVVKQGDAGRDEIYTRPRRGEGTVA